ncbi:MAG: hypothetical protein GXY77_17685 [Fibrobacter sp.]|nr:hypothetical protein [Fibrobacter sp.]
MKKVGDMEKRMNRRQIVLTNADDLHKQDNKYWSHASIEEKMQTITYLRECFYGPEATTGRLQRFHKILKLK